MNYYKGYTDNVPRWGIATTHAVNPDTEQRKQFGWRGVSLCGVNVHFGKDGPPFGTGKPCKKCEKAAAKITVREVLAGEYHPDEIKNRARQ